jgi:hypothetical protein
VSSLGNDGQRVRMVVALSDAGRVAVDVRSRLIELDSVVTSGSDDVFTLI